MATSVYTLRPALMGINLDSPADSLPDGYATNLSNISPFPERIAQRSAKTTFATATGASGYYDNLSVYTSIYTATGTNLIAGTDTAISKINITNAAVTNVGSGYTSASWYFQQWRGYFWAARFNALAATAYYRYDGTTFTDATTLYTCSGSANYTASHFIPHKSRMYLVVNYSSETEIWYSGVNSVSGALTQFVVSGIFQEGGIPLAVGSLSRMSTAGDVSQFVVISSEGEVLIYDGDNPGASNWVLTRRFTIPRPLQSGRYTNAVISANQDVYVLTTEGVISLNLILSGDPVGKTSPVASAIRDAWDYQNNWQESGRNQGHAVHFDSQKGWLFSNLSSRNDASVDTYVKSFKTGATTKYPVNASAWTSYGDDLYYMTGGVVSKISESNGTEDSTWAIASNWSDLGQPYTQKTISAIRVRLDSTLKGNIPNTNTFDVTFSIDSDFVPSGNLYTFSRTYVQRTATPDPWIPAVATGTRFKINVNGSTLAGATIGAIDIRFSPGRV